MDGITIEFTLDLNVLAKYIDQRFPTLRLIKQKAQWLHNCTMTQTSAQLLRDPNWAGRGWIMCAHPSYVSSLGWEKLACQCMTRSVNTKWIFKS